jgi:predicted RND superfamily exporter protein
LTPAVLDLARWAVMPMTQPSFLARKSLGQPNYLLIALAAAFVLALTPLAAWRTIQGNANRPVTWLPNSVEAVADLQWLGEQFDGPQRLAVSWDGCTFRETEKLRALARKLAAAESTDRPGEKLFSAVISGPDVVAQLTSTPYNLSREAALARLEGTLVGPAKNADQDSRATCLVAQLQPGAQGDELASVNAIAAVRALAVECSIDPATLRLAGSAADAAAIDSESLGTLMRWAPLAAIAGILIAAWRLQSFALGAVIVCLGAASAAVTLAIAHYVGIFEVLALKRPAPMLGQGDAMILTVAIIPYVLTIATALRLVHYYRDARLEGRTEGAAEQAVQYGRPWWAFTALILAAMLGVYCYSLLVPARRASVFGALGVLASVALVLAVLPVVLHRFKFAERWVRAAKRDGRGTPRWLDVVFEHSLSARAGLIPIMLALLGAGAWGATRLNLAPAVPPLASDNSQLARDYRWFGDHVGHATFMNVAVAIPDERARQTGAPPEADGQQYQLSPAERLQLMAQLEDRMRTVRGVGGVLSPADFTPAETASEGEDAIGVALAEYALVRDEHYPRSDRATGRQLLRAIAHVASTAEDNSIDYAVTERQLRAAVDPVLLAYEQRDAIVRSLHQRAARLEGARLTLLFRAARGAAGPDEGSAEALLAGLLRRSGVAGGEISYLNLADFDHWAAATPAMRDRMTASLKDQTAVVLAASGGEATVEELAMQGVPAVNVAEVRSIEESETTLAVETGGPRPIRAIFASPSAVATAVSDELRSTMQIAAVVALPSLAMVLMAAWWSPVGGLAVMLPIALPLAVVLGALGWTGWRVGLGVIVVAPLCLAVSLEAAIHFVAWFRRGAHAGLTGAEAARMAYYRVAPSMLDALLVAGVGLSALAVSGVASMQLVGGAVGVAMVAGLATGVALLPAMLAGSLGRHFGAIGSEPAPRADQAPSPAPHVGDASYAPERKDVAAASPMAPHRLRTTVAVDQRREAVDGSHAALQAKLRQLRRSANDSAS